MHSSTARGFYVMLLSRDEREKLRDLEKSLPPGRYYTNAELGSIFRLELKKEARVKTEADLLAMDDLWQQYNREIWKARKIMGFRLSQDRLTAIETELTSLDQGEKKSHGQTNKRIDDDSAAFGNWASMDAEERYNWGEYVLAHYRRPQSSADSLDEAFGMMGA